jgi:hypothetical protein
MPPILIDCQSCRRKLRVPEELLGRPVKCPTCQYTFTVSIPADSSHPGSSTIHPEQEHLPAEPASFQPPAALPESGPGAAHPQPRQDRPWEFRGRRDAEPHRGSTILVLGIMSIVASVFCFPPGLVLGIVAVVMGRSDLNKMNRRLMDREGEGTTRAGWVCGIVGTVLSGMSCLFCMLYVGAVITFAVQASKQQGPFAPPPGFKQAPAAPQQAPTDKDTDNDNQDEKI